MVLDPVCGMEIEPAEAVGLTELEGERYYFCSSTCKERFDAEPQRFVALKEVLHT